MPRAQPFLPHAHNTFVRQPPSWRTRPLLFSVTANTVSRPSLFASSLFTSPLDVLANVGPVVGNRERSVRDGYLDSREQGAKRLGQVAWNGDVDGCGRQPLVAFRDPMRRENAS